MRFWPVFISFLFNVTYGLLLPLVPKLGLETAGVAFSSFALIKLVLTVPSGHLTDKLGSWRATGAALVLQALGLAAIVALPDHAWVGRGLEGFALALGQVAVVSLCRNACATPMEFEKLVGQVVGIGSLGYVVGPALGFFLMTGDPVVPIYLAGAATAAVAVVHFVLERVVAKPAAMTVHASDSLHVSPRIAILFMIALGCAKALVVGMEPLFAWWASDVFKLTPLVAGLTFVLLSVAFLVGTLKANLKLAVLSTVGVVFIEGALRGHVELWWIGLLLVGYWDGVVVSTSVGRLGWNKPDTVGRHNARWLALTDFPMAVMPVLVWSLREPDQWIPRASITTLTLAIGTFTLWKGLRSSSVVPAGTGSP
jgi:MFS family permease